MFIAITFLLIAKITCLLLPSNIVWLNKDQVSKLDEFFMDGSIGGLVVGFFKSVILKDE